MGDYSVHGLAVLALVILVLGYVVPHRVRQRQVWSQAKVDDRFSGSLRVLPGAHDPTSGQTQHGSPSGGRLHSGHQAASLTTPHQPLAVESPAAIANKSASSSDQKDGTVMGTSVIESTPQTHTGGRMTSSRLVVLERRAAAARRRLVLTVLLLVVTLLVAGGAIWDYVPLWAPAAPAAILMAVLVLGFRAARAARRSDALWLEQRRKQRDRHTPAGTASNHGRSSVKVTGRAVHGSHAATQMIPKVPAPAAARPREAAAQASDDPAEGSPDDAIVTAEHDGAASVDHHGDAGDGELSVPLPRSVAPWEQRPPSNRVWDPVALPRPTYALKPTAPVVEEPSPEPQVFLPPASRLAGEDARPRTETLGLDLNEILARRRAVGQ